MEVSFLKTWIKTLIEEEVRSVILHEKKIYHSFDSKNGFDINKMDYERGIFGLGEETFEWARERYGINSKKADPFQPNEFGDKVVEIEVSDSAKIYTAGDQTDVLEKEFSNNPRAKHILNIYSTGNFGIDRSDWHKLDKMIGRQLRKKGYQLIHYTADQMYGDTWTITDKNIIKNIRYGK